MKSPVTFILLAGLAGGLSAQNLVLPDNHYLGESATQLQITGSTAWFGTTAGGRRMMVLYEASHFTGKAGVLGAVDLTHVKFRGEDTEKNTGGQTFSNVTVSLYKTTLTSSTMSTTSFVTNLAPAPGNTTTLMRTANIPLVTVAPSLGTGPNNFAIDLDVSASPILASYDPVADPAGEVHFLVDINWTGYANGPAIPPSATTITMIALQDTSAHGAGIRGRGINATTPGATTGTASANPPIMGVEFNGGGGYATLIPATTEYYGASCGGSASTFYQSFVHNQPFDLANTGLTLTPDVPPPAAPNAYVVTAGAPPVDVTKVNASPNSTGDDTTLATTSLGFSAPFQFPGGSTSAIRASTNGFVWMDTTMTAADSSPTVAEWLGAGPSTVRFAPFWHDFDGGENTVTHPNSGLHQFTDVTGGAGNAVCYVTWLNTGEFNVVAGGGQTVNTLQCVFHEATGVVQFRYGPMSRLDGGSVGNPLNGIVGFTRGRIGTVNSVDPQSHDLSHELPLTTKPEVSSNVSFTTTSTPLAAGASYGARMFGGQSITFNVGNIPTSPLTLGFINLDLIATQPGLQLPGLTAPDCRISTGVPPLILGWETWVASGPTFTGTLPLTVQHAWLGSMITGQALGLDISGGPNLVAWASNSIKWVVGLD